MEKEIADKLKTFFGAYPEHALLKGATLIHGHEDPPGVIQLLAGSVAQYDIGKDGQKIVVNIFRTGAFFPMSWAINKVPNTYIFEALDTLKYRVAPPDDTVAFLLKNPDVLLNLLGRVYKGTDGVLKRMTYLMAGDARTRLLFEIYITCRRFGRMRTDGGCTVEIKESDLAAYTGLSRETVSRLLQRLEGEGLLEHRRGRLVVGDIGKVERVLGAFKRFLDVQEVTGHKVEDKRWEQIGHVAEWRERIADVGFGFAGFHKDIG